LGLFTTLLGLDLGNMTGKLKYNPYFCEEEFK